MRQRIDVFLKGNADIVDPIFGVRWPSGESWGGLNAVFREHGRAITARVRHETAGGFGLLDGADLPDDVMAHADLFGTFRPNLQHSRALFEVQANAVILSLQPDIGVQRWRHRASGLAFVLHDARRWPSEATAWRKQAFEPLPLSTPDEAMAALLDIVARLHRDREVAVLVANMTAVAPGETLHAFLGMPETLTQRVQRFNLALVEAARQADFSILDVDRLVATGGAERLIYDRMHYTLELCRRSAAEVARILEERGVIGS